MDPPFQRRSVWNDRYREEFIDTILLDYPAPAIFLFSSIDDSGATKYQLVDGKQRLTTIFDFIEGRISIGDRSPMVDLRGRYFTGLSKTQKISFFEYDFSVEYLPTNNEQVINAIFDRLNRNVAKLTPQELRHARFSGRFISQTEELQEWMESRLQKQFPRIAESSRRQMKDVEVVATLLLFLEEGPKSYSTLTLDKAFSDREEEWEAESRIVDEFKNIINQLSSLIEHPDGTFIPQTRLRNQADFYSLFAAFAELARERALPGDPGIIAIRLKAFLEILESERLTSSRDATTYFDASRSASNDAGPRQKRISIMKQVIRGDQLA
jgi:hypothetical protein